MKRSVQYLCSSSFVIDHVHINIVSAVTECETVVSLGVGECWLIIF